MDIFDKIVSTDKNVAFNAIAAVIRRHEIGEVSLSELKTEMRAPCAAFDRSVQKQRILWHATPRIRMLSTAPFLGSKSVQEPEQTVWVPFSHLVRCQKTDAARLYVLAVTGARAPEWRGAKRLGDRRVQTVAYAIGRGNRAEIARAMERAASAEELRAMCADLAACANTQTAEGREWATLTRWLADPKRQAKLYAARLIERNYRSYRWRKNTLYNPYTMCGKVYLGCTFERAAARQSVEGAA